MKQTKFFSLACSQIVSLGQFPGLCPKDNFLMLKIHEEYCYRIKMKTDLQQLENEYAFMNSYISTNNLKS